MQSWKLQGDLRPPESPGKALEKKGFWSCPMSGAPALRHDFAERFAGSSLFKMQSGKGMLNGQTYLSLSNWDVNSGKAAAARPNKLAQALIRLVWPSWKSVLLLLHHC